MSFVSTLEYLKIIFDNPLLEEADVKLLWEKGIIEEYDVLNLSRPVDRRSAARIAHQYMLKEINISDIEDISSASILRDLYDCRVCVNHIAQVYLRHIMDGIEIPGLSESGFVIFDSRKEVGIDEARRIKEKLKSLKLSLMK